MSLPILVGVEHEYQLDPLRGPLDFRQMIHTLGIDGARLDPGDVHAYRLRSGVVLTADGVTAEVATPPVPLVPDFVESLVDLQQAGLRELTRALPEGTPVFGYSTHISVSVPDALNDELCALYARTFGPALMFQMNSIRTEGIFIRPRPGRIEFCGNYLPDDRLRSAAVFAAASVAACFAHLEGSSTALAALPDDIEVAIGTDPIRYGLYLLADSFSPGVSEREQDLLLRAGSGTVSLGELLRQSWSAVQAFLPDTPPAEDFASDGRSYPRRDLGESPASGATTAVRPTIAYLGRPELAAYGAILEPVARPRFGVSAVAAVWDFTILEIADHARTGYVTVPRALLPAFWTELTEGARDAQIEDFLDAGAHGRVLETNHQTQQFGLWDDLVVSQRLLSPERLPSPAASARATSEVGGTSERSPAAPASGTSSGPAPTSTIATTEGAARPGKRPRSLIPGHTGAPVDETPTGGDDEVPGRPGKRSAELDPGRVGKIPLEAPPLISLPSPFDQRILVAMLIAVLVVVVIVVLLLTGGGGTTEEPAATGTAASTGTTEATVTATSGVTVPPPVVGPITALLAPPTTTYSIEASSPDGLVLSYRWTLVADEGQDCGTITPSDAATATPLRSFVQWSHANEAPDDCNHDAADHPFNIEVEVSDGVNPAVTRSYRGSKTGTGPDAAE